MADLAPQFAALQGRLGDLGASPVPPPGPPSAPVLPLPSPLPIGPTTQPISPPEGLTSLLSSPWLWVGIAVLLLVALYFWYNSQKKKKD